MYCVNMNTPESMQGATVVHTAQRTGPEEVTTAVIEAIATFEGIDPIDLDVRIGDVVDPDALNALFKPTDTNRTNHVTFSLGGYLVRVSAAGEIVLYRP